LEKLATILQKPTSGSITQDEFPDLEHLELTTQNKDGLILHDQFLGGAAPRLHTLRTIKIALPGLPQLLYSATNLVSLQLEAIPSTGYIPPEDLITTLSEMTRLQMFYVHFISPTSLTDSKEYLGPPPIRVTLPSLKYFEFHGDCEYLDRLSDGIDAPIIKYIYLTFFNDLDYPIPKLVEFISRTETSSFRVEATVHYSATDLSITFSQPDSPRRLVFRIPSTQFFWQMTSIADICGQLQPSTTFSAVRQLDIYASPPLPGDHDDMDHTLFLDFFRVFGGVESLRVTKEIGSHVAHALAGSTVLPVMQDFYVEEHDEFASVQTAIAPFIAARRRSDHPVSLHPWEPINSSTGQPRTGSTRIPASFIQRNDPALALEEDIRQTCERFSPRSFAICSLHQRAQSLLLSFMRTRKAIELENSIEVARDLFEMHPRQMRRVKLLRMLAFCYALGSQPGHRNKSVSMFEDAFQDESATTSERLTIAWWWATFARAWDHPSTTLAYQNTLAALHGALTGAIDVQWNPSTTGLLGSKIHIPLDYASYQIEKGQLELAVETIEQGKTMIWSDIYGLRTSAGRLRMANPDLAERLATVSQDLAAVNASILAHRAAASRLDEEEDHEHMDTFSPMFKEQRRLLRERQEIVAGIKALPGFENFMETERFRTLQDAASRGPIIFINHCRWRCDILIVRHNLPPSLITTTEGFYEQASTLANTLLEARRKYAVESELFQQELRSILKELYERVGQPVVDELRKLRIPEQSRIWWYPTSVFCALPLHAMGPVPSTDGRERYFSDLYICSYTPTLGSLIAARTPVAPTSDRGPTLLFVGRPNESPRGTRDMKVIRSIGVPATRLVFGNATREAVINGLQKHRLAHFACRSHREDGKPFDTALELDGGDRIALLDMVRCRVPTTELAVLSTGRTAELVDGTDFVEGLHLAAAMQHYGFGSVVGTMWDLGDVGGEDLSLGFYKEMLSGGAEGDTLPSERSARAMQYMVQKLRETRVTLQRWANWVHYGA
jgi:CHAT domain-containing protein